MKALILSCNTGGGHNSAGRAVAEEFVSRGDEAYVLDYLTLAGQGVSRIVGNGYVQIVNKAFRSGVPFGNAGQQVDEKVAGLLPERQDGQISG